MPMFYVRCYFNHITGEQSTCRFATFLIISHTSDSNEDLSARMAVPVISATGFKSNVGHGYIQVFVTGQRCQPGFSCKILLESRIFLS